MGSDFWNFALHRRTYHGIGDGTDLDPFAFLVPIIYDSIDLLSRSMKLVKTPFKLYILQDQKSSCHPDGQSENVDQRE